MLDWFMDRRIAKEIREDVRQDLEEKLRILEKVQAWASGKENTTLTVKLESKIWDLNGPPYMVHERNAKRKRAALKAYRNLHTLNWILERLQHPDGDHLPASPQQAPQDTERYRQAMGRVLEDTIETREYVEDALETL